MVARCVNSSKLGLSVEGSVCSVVVWCGRGVGGVGQKRSYDEVSQSQLRRGETRRKADA